MKRKGKKSPPTTAKKIPASPNKPTSSKNRSLPKLKRKSTATGKKKVKSSPKAMPIASSASAKKPPAIESNVVAKGNFTAKSMTASSKKLSLSWLIISTIAIIIGVSTILGTTMAIASSFKTTVAKPNIDQNQPQNFANKAKLEQLLVTASLGKEINPLKNKIETLANEYPDLEPEVFLVDLDTKGFISIRGQNAIASASTIKLPILVAFFQAIDRGKIQLDEQLTMTKEMRVGGSGDMQHQPVGTKFLALEAADKMITISDNTATNMLIDRLGGMSALNQRFMAMGLGETKLSNPLPDLTGTNTTSPEDLGNLLIKIDSGELLSLRSRDRLLHIMGNVEKDTLLPQGLESGALIAHKTGDIKSVLADVGIIDMPNGKRYIASMLIKRPDNSLQAQEFIQQASGIAYQYFKNSQAESFTIKENE